MADKKQIDIYIADFLRRCFAFYIRIRTNTNQKVDDEAAKDIIWDNKFDNQKEYFSFILPNNNKINLYKDSVLCKLIYFGFEKNEINFLRKILKNGDVFFDVGANIGLFSLNASDIVGNNGKIYAFEPTKKTYLRLKNNIENNNLTNVTTENIGLSNRSEVLNFFSSNNLLDAWNGFVKLPRMNDFSEENVEVSTLNLYIKEKSIQKIDFIKIDVEGWEYRVLQGATDVLNRNDAPILMVEFTETNAFAAGYYCGELFDFIKTFGYEWYKYDHENDILMIQEKQLHYIDENLIAIKNIRQCEEQLKLAYKINND